MLTTLAELIAYSQALAERDPDTFADRVFRTPGLSSAQVTGLVKALPRIPQSFLSVVGGIDFTRVGIGFFSFGQVFSRVKGYVNSLIFFNDEAECPFCQYCHQDHAYLVAWCEADPVGLVHTDGPFKRDQILIYNVGYIEQPPTVLADNFTQLLLIAGNLDEIRDRYMDKHMSDTARAEFAAYLDWLNPSADIKPYWAVYAQSMLADWD